MNRSPTEKAPQNLPKRSLISRAWPDAGHRAQPDHHLLVDHQDRDEEGQGPQQREPEVLPGLAVGGDATGVVVAHHDDETGAHDGQQGEQAGPPGPPGVEVVLRGWSRRRPGCRPRGPRRGRRSLVALVAASSSAMGHLLWLRDLLGPMTDLVARRTRRLGRRIGRPGWGRPSYRARMRGRTPGTPTASGVGIRARCGAHRSAAGAVGPDLGRAPSACRLARPGGRGCGARALRTLACHGRWPDWGFRCRNTVSPPPPFGRSRAAIRSGGAVPGRRRP